MGQQLTHPLELCDADAFSSTSSALARPVTSAARPWDRSGAPSFAQPAGAYGSGTSYGTGTGYGTGYGSAGHGLTGYGIGTYGSTVGGYSSTGMYGGGTYGSMAGVLGKWASCDSLWLRAITCHVCVRSASPDVVRSCAVSRAISRHMRLRDAVVEAVLCSCW